VLRVALTTLQPVVFDQTQSFSDETELRNRLALTLEATSVWITLYNTWKFWTLRSRRMKSSSLYSA